MKKMFKFYPKSNVQNLVESIINLLNKEQKYPAAIISQSTIYFESKKFQLERFKCGSVF